MSLAAIERFCVPADLIAETERQLHEAGQLVAERFVLWSGSQRARVFDVDAVHIPEQTAYRLETGLCVRIDGPALHRLNEWLFEHGQRLAAQVHAHPNDAYHSDTDDAYPIVTKLGGLSVVVPDFCERGLLGRGTAAYRLTRRGWERSPVPAASLIKEA